MINAIAIDDEPPALRIIEHFCNKNRLINLAGTFTDSGCALEFMNKNQIDLIFIDIQMPGFNGVEFYKNLDNKPMVIFTTAFSEYAVEGFNLNAVDYLLKPYPQERFDKAVNKAALILKNQVKEKRTITLRSKYSEKSIEIDNILFIESFDDYAVLNFRTGDVLEIRITLKKLLEILPEDEFIRVHRSYIISFNHIIEVRNKIISIGNRKIPISSSYEKHFFECFHQQ